jgi:hypothetical protein
MTPGIRHRAVCALLLGLLAPQSHGQKPCAAPGTEWACYGAIEMGYQGERGRQTIRAVVFANEELLAEVERVGTKKRLLVAQPSRVELFSGLAESDSLDPLHNPFVFLDIAFSLPLASLATAFPAGPSSVPQAVTEREVQLDGRHWGMIRASRLRSGQIRFQLLFPDLAVRDIEGSWEGIRRTPLPNDFSIGVWKSRSPEPMATLGEARVAGTSLSREPADEAIPAQ